MPIIEDEIKDKIGTINHKNNFFDSLVFDNKEFLLLYSTVIKTKLIVKGLKIPKIMSMVQKAGTAYHIIDYLDMSSFNFSNLILSFSTKFNSSQKVFFIKNLIIKDDSQKLITLENLLVVDQPISNKKNSINNFFPVLKACFKHKQNYFFIEIIKNSLVYNQNLELEKISEDQAKYIIQETFSLIKIKN